jgi:Transposase DDE domain group 1
VTNIGRPSERIVAFYNERATCEQWIKEGKGAIKWTRLSCRSFAADAVRLQLHALAYNLGNFLRTLATPEELAPLQVPGFPAIQKIVTIQQNRGAIWEIPDAIIENFRFQAEDGQAGVWGGGVCFTQWLRNSKVEPGCKPGRADRRD